jgi:hypothetical protein
MSSLNSFRILSKKDNIIKVEVCMVHPDEHYINDSTNFALQIIVELYERIKSEYFNISHFSLSIEETKASVLPENKLFLDELLVKMRWREIPISEEEYETRQKNNDYTYKGQKTAGMGFSDGKYCIYLETEYDDFCREADKHIELVEVLSVCDFPHWFDRLETWLETGNGTGYGFDEEIYNKYEDKPYPSYILQITLNPKSVFLLPHIQEGSSWDSAAYNFEGYTKKYTSPKEPIYHCLAYDIDEKAFPNDNTLTIWWAELSPNWKNAFMLNLHIQKYYLFPEIKPRYHNTVFLYAFEDALGKDSVNKLAQKEPTTQDLRLMSQLKIMYLSGFQLTDLAPLKLLKSLKILSSEGNAFESIELLSEFTSLEELHLIIYNNPISSHVCLKNLSKLRILTFDAIHPEDLNIILNMPNLRDLYVFAMFDVHPNIFMQCSSLKRLIITERANHPEMNPSKQELIHQLRAKNIDITWESEYISEEDDDHIFYLSY